MMTGVHDLGLFILAGVLLNLTRGVDFRYVRGRSAARGFAAGVWAALGIGAGCFVHIIAAALGLSAILASSAAAFTVVKWIGAAYLLYVGIGMFRQRGVADDHRAAVSTAAQAVGMQAAGTHVAGMQAAGQVQAFLLLGTIFNTTGTLWNLFVAWSSASLARRLDVASRVGRWLNRALGAMFIALGVKLALTERA